MKKFFVILLSGLLLTGLSSCYFPHEIEGNNNLVTVSRTVGMFSGVDNNGSLQVQIIRDSISFVEIEAEENLVPYIETDVNDGILSIHIQHHRNIDPNYPIIVFVHTPGVESIEMSGSGSISTDTLFTSNMDVKLSGSGNISLKCVTQSINARISGSGEISLMGQSDQADMSISGSGNLHAYGFPVNTCMADISGSGNMYLHVDTLLDVVISGSGDVYYYGNPSVTVNVLGSGHVIHQ